jgi:hypothetical protein
MELATEIKQSAVQLMTNPPDEETFLWVETDPAIDMPLERPLWTPPITINYADIEPEVALLDLSAIDLKALFDQFYVDESRLHRYIATLLEQKPTVTLGEIAAVYPITQGLAELVTYFGIAARDEACQINGDEWEEIKLGENRQVVRLPLVIYQKPGRENV